MITSYSNKVWWSDHLVNQSYPWLCREGARIRMLVKLNCRRHRLSRVFDRFILTLVNSPDAYIRITNQTMCGYSWKKFITNKHHYISIWGPKRFKLRRWNAKFHADCDKVSHFSANCILVCKKIISDFYNLAGLFSLHCYAIWNFCIRDSALQKLK